MAVLRPERSRRLLPKLTSAAKNQDSVFDHLNQARENCLGGGTYSALRRSACCFCFCLSSLVSPIMIPSRQSSSMSWTVYISKVSVLSTGWNSYSQPSSRFSFGSCKLCALLNASRFFGCQMYNMYQTRKPTVAQQTRTKNKLFGVNLGDHNSEFSYFSCFSCLSLRISFIAGWQTGFERDTMRLPQYLLRYSSNVLAQSVVISFRARSTEGLRKYTCSLVANISVLASLYYFLSCSILIVSMSQLRNNILTVRNPIIVYAVALGISAGAFVMGYSLVCLSMLQQEIAKANGLSTEESTNYLSLLTTALPLGAILGSLLLRPLCTKFGENRTMILIDLFALAAFVIQGTELTIPHLLLGRIMVGVCCGISSGIIPQYLASISPRAAFGVIGTFNQLLITIGIASAYYAGNFLPGTAPSSNLLSPETFIALPSLFCIARIVLLLFFPYDTVERHYGNKQFQALEEYMSLFYTENEVKKLEIANELGSVAGENISSCQSLPSKENFLDSAPTNGRILRLAIVLALANQLSGINAILFYAKQLFLQIGNQDQHYADTSVLNLGIFQVVVTFFSGFLINGLGRRTLMLFGQSIVAISLLSGFIINELPLESQSKQTLLLGVVFAHLLGFSLSLGPVSMMYAAQIMEDLSRLVLLIWVLTLAVSGVSGILIASMGIGRVFLIYGIISAFCLWYLSLEMFESKGLTRREIVSQFCSKSSSKRRKS